MKTFLRFIGILELIGYVVGLILLTINITLVGIYIFYYISYIIFAPVFGVICLSIAEILDRTENIEHKVTFLTQKLLKKNDSDEQEKDNSTPAFESGQPALDFKTVTVIEDTEDIYGHKIKKNTVATLLSVDKARVRVLSQDENGKSVIVYLKKDQVRGLD